MKKGLHTVICSLALTVLISVNAMAAFSDMPLGDDGACLKRAVDNKLLTGYEDGTIRPQNPIKRSEMAAIMVRALGATKKADISSFTDVSENEWYYDVMAQAVEMEAFKGNSDATLNPTNEITRQEALIVLSRVFCLPNKDTSVLDIYTDGNSVSDWAKQEVSKVVGGGYLPNSTTLRPLENMTRLEFAQIMDKLVSAYITESGEYTSENMPSGNILVKAENVSFKGAVNTGTIYIGDGVQGETAFTNNDFAYIIIRGGSAVFNSGKCYSARAMGKNTKIILRDSPMNLLKPFEDGTYGSFHGEPGHGTVYVSVANVELE